LVTPSILGIDPYRFNALINKAFTLDNLSRYNESLAYFDKVLTINPDEDIALNGKGEALLKLGNYDEAIPYFDKILAINSSDSGLLVVASKN
jgi:tetratricopeptide (TPR) repeat protein